VDLTLRETMLLGWAG